VVIKAELVDAIAEHIQEPRKNVAPIVDAVFASIIESLSKGKKCTIYGFGVFEKKDRAARKGRNPRDPSKAIPIPARKVPVFRAGKSLKEKVLAVNKTKKKRQLTETAQGRKTS
jgi:DNA-binding protein HU-beta